MSAYCCYQDRYVELTLERGGDGREERAVINLTFHHLHVQLGGGEINNLLDAGQQVKLSSVNSYTTTTGGTSFISTGAPHRKDGTE